MGVQKARDHWAVAYEVKRGKGQEGTGTRVSEDPESLCLLHLHSPSEGRGDVEGV